MEMPEFEWDAKKAALNLKKHGISFSFAARVFLDDHRLDDREDYGENRFVAIGLINASEIVVVYALREDTIRIISARKADDDEIETYWNR